ncbi:MAG: tRNA (adenosine(37)-N6)-threonylcarbamoyltransferase complex dimerization subunit type 1 TsaB [Deltaproteobacteria bacterium]|nr:tRNA (adenosine(37)-N6)-threonylcarbamoyltransferase complex dimerization subunit type 1 TsaB [Deltaproteobacteria bacterium]
MITLAIDTSTDSAGVALLNDEEVLSETFLNVGLHHSLYLLPAISSIFTTTGMAPADADLFACTIGPGSFTGLRVGASTIKGLALATGKPVVGISTLNVLALNLADCRVDVCPMLDALNGKVYTALYRNRGTALPDRIVDESLADVEDFLKGIGQETVFVGTGAQKYADRITTLLPGKGRIASNHHHHIRAATVGFLGLKKFADGDFLDIRTFTPQYLQQSYAEKSGIGGL